jgi:hypothetical protein
MRLSKTINPRRWVPLRTLGDAAHFIEELPEARKTDPAWQYAAAVIDGAATTGEKQDIAEATALLKLPWPTRVSAALLLVPRVMMKVAADLLEA